MMVFLPAARYDIDERLFGEISMIAEIAANIRVIAEFGPKGIRPRLFIWERRRHTVNKITADWEEREGAHRRLYFAVQTEESGEANVYELAFSTRDLTWALTRIHTDG